jgi:D-alanyl-D-alanine carboxypeptidase/D-alanyl-D-alanine-endopeptidase (penicillin-binding protein 4)
MKRCHSLWLCALLALAGAGAPGQTTNDTLPALQARLGALLDQPRFAQAQWGVKVLSLDSGRTIFERNAGKLLKPASNAKLYTAALALDRLGPDYRIKTSFYAAAKPDENGVIHGDLLVYGRGDPSFSARFNGGDYNKALLPALQALRAAGVRKIEGGVIGDESFFRGPPLGDDWTWEDLQEYYGAPASALSFQDNVIDLVFKPGRAVDAPCDILTMPQTSILTFSNRTRTVPANEQGRIRIYRPVGETVVYVRGGVPLNSEGETGAVSVPRPALWFAAMLKEGLAENGVAVTTGAREANWLDREVSPLPWSNLTEVAFVLSRPVSEIVKQTLKPSENLYAQLLLLQVGARAQAANSGSGRSTEAAGLAEMQAFLREAGIAPNLAWLREGSGLSRAALITPNATVQLLAFMDRHRCRDAFIDALPVAGVDGTLRNRLKGTVAAGNIRAKTGSLAGVSALSGYLTTAANERWAFSIMLNNYHGTESAGSAALDPFALALAAFTGHSAAP